MSDIVSRPFHPGDKCCEACVFGSGEHAEWCKSGKLLEKFRNVYYDPMVTFSISAEEIESAQEPCSECEQRGYILDDCKTCYGNGYIDGYDEDDA